MSVKIILGDTSPITKKVFSLSLDSPDYLLIFAEDEESLKEVVVKENPQVVVLSSNITPQLNHLVQEISRINPSINVLVLKSPFEKMEVEEGENVKIFIKPVPSSKIKQYMESLKAQLPDQETPQPEEEEETIYEEEGLPEEDELSEEELQATTWESHTSEEAFSDEDIFPEEEELEQEEVFEEPTEETLIHEELVQEEEEREEILEEVAEPAVERKFVEEGEAAVKETVSEVKEKVKEVLARAEGAHSLLEKGAEPEEPTLKAEAQEPQPTRETPVEVKTAEENPPVSAEIPREVIEKIAWEVIPPLAEKILREEIQKLVKKLEES